jgi:DNA-binding LacI/PurR family transcriptional regulator
LATISDVAKLAGLSRATVSRVINNHPYVTEEKKQLVCDAMYTLGYKPNHSAQRLRKQKTDTIAVLVPRLSNPFFAYLVEHIEVEANKHNLQLLICHTKYDKTRELKFIDLLKTKQVDGIIFTSIENDWNVVCPLLQDAPVVLCNEYQNDDTIPMVKLDQELGGYIGTRQLILSGHTKLGYCSGGNGSGIARDRELGFRKAIQEAGISFNEEWFFNGILNIEDGRKVVKETLKMSDGPTAFFTGSDEVAAGIISEARISGLRIPEDIAVVGFDNQPLASIVVPSLTTIEQPIELMAQSVMKMMTLILSGEIDKLESRIVELPLKLVERDSCKSSILQ